MWWWYSCISSLVPFPASIRSFHSPASLDITSSNDIVQEVELVFSNWILLLSALKLSEYDIIGKWERGLYHMLYTHIAKVYLFKSGCRTSLGKEIWSSPMLFFANGPCNLQNDQGVLEEWVTLNRSPLSRLWYQTPSASVKNSYILWCVAYLIRFSYL